jgi:hypothetical protein
MFMLSLAVDFRGVFQFGKAHAFLYLETAFSVLV